ncbi:uncharacterized protein LOC111091159 isoform X23 [Canis lupus familiaris]|uniref:uncharacterized protein LOC111091159 isoform X23 n=1 Tax=Canis lupus familiaris TaxID=9615 RepID=UPI0018F43C5B|nr:uncharacterized protein LOC111091159 isoform X23 [Canis lupus familiaris]
MDKSERYGFTKKTTCASANRLSGWPFTSAAHSKLKNQKPETKKPDMEKHPILPEKDLVGSWAPSELVKPNEPCALLGHESYILICATSSPGLWIPHRLELVYPCMSRIQEKLIIVSLFYQISTLIQPFSLVILKQKGKKLFFFFFFFGKNYFLAQRIFPKIFPTKHRLDVFVIFPARGYGLHLFGCIVTV